MTKLNVLYHNPSYSLGGIQQTMRMIKEVASNECDNIGVTEFNFSGDIISEQSAFSYPIFKRLFFKLLPAKVAFFIKMMFYRARFIGASEECFIIFNPIWLLAIPFSALNKNVILVQTNRFDKYFSKFSLFIFKFYIEKIDSIVTYTENDAEEFEKCFKKLKGKVDYSFIPRGCKLDTASHAPKFGKKLLFVGRISERSKNLTGLVRAFEMLGHEYSLTIAGGGEADEVACFAKLIENNHRINYIGPVTDDNKIKELYRSHNLFLMTSHYEGFGNTLIEARSQGLPIVAFDTFTALRWVVENNQTGCVVKPYDYAAFKDCIIKLTSDELTYHAFTHSALLKAKETEKDKVISKWVSLLSRF